MHKISSIKLSWILFLLHLQHTVLRNSELTQPQSTINQKKPWEVVRLPKDPFGRNGKLSGLCCYYFGSATWLIMWTMIGRCYFFLNLRGENVLSSGINCKLFSQLREVETGGEDTMSVLQHHISWHSSRLTNPHSQGLMISSFFNYNRSQTWWWLESRENKFKGALPWCWTYTYISVLSRGLHCTWVWSQVIRCFAGCVLYIWFYLSLATLDKIIILALLLFFHHVIPSLV